MSSYEEIIYVKKSLRMDFCELLTNLSGEYEKEFLSFLNSYEVIRKYCELTYLFDMTWVPLDFKKESFMWIKTLADQVKYEKKYAKNGFIKKVRINLSFTSESSVEIRLPFYTRESRRVRERYLASLWKALFIKEYNSKILKYSHSEIYYEVLQGNIEFANIIKQKAQTKNIPHKERKQENSNAI